MRLNNQVRGLERGYKIRSEEFEFAAFAIDQDKRGRREEARKSRMITGRRDVDAVTNAIELGDHPAQPLRIGVDIEGKDLAAGVPQREADRVIAFTATNIDDGLVAPVDESFELGMQFLFVCS